jgi:twitching motility protein PilT
MREDPDVIVVGEMRDTETMNAALTLAETGHLTFATLHTSSAIQTVSRVISAFPSTQQAQIRIQLATTLQYVICQKLIPWDNGEGRSLAAEVLALTPAVRSMIRDEKTHQIKTAMQTNFESGMRTLNQSLEQLIEQGRISLQTAACYSEERQELLQGNSVGTESSS